MYEYGPLVAMMSGFPCQMFVAIKILSMLPHSERKMALLQTHAAVK